MDTKELLETQIYPNLDVEALLSELEPKDKQSHYRLICPSCEKKEAYISKRGGYDKLVFVILSCQKYY